MDRRGFIAGAASLTALAGSARADIDGLRAAAREGWIYGLPLIEMAGARDRALSQPFAGPDAGGQRPGLNGFIHARNLAGPASRGVTTPNNDTLYSSAWLDLSVGAVSISFPPTGARYFSLALMDMYTNNIRVIGTRSGAGGGGEVVVIGPPKKVGVGDVAIAEPRLPRPQLPWSHPLQVHAPGHWVWALARTLVEGEADLPGARAVQDGLFIRAHRGARVPPPTPGRDAAWNDYFFAVQQLIEDNPPPAADDDFFHRISPLQLGARSGFERARFADAELAEIESGIDEARASLLAPGAARDAVQGWTYPRPDLGDWRQDYLARARTALTGLGALPPAEAMYMRAVGPDGRVLFNSDDNFRLSLPGALPVDGFWSLTLYEVTTQGQLFLTQNPIHRYAIGDRTSGLRRRADGGIDIWIGRADPGGSHTANWLPAPASGPFALVLRAYLPKPELLDGRYRLPPVEALGGGAR